MSADARVAAPPASRRRALFAVLLAWFFPGLGHAYFGNRKLAVA
jgi:hypothetical protein